MVERPQGDAKESRELTLAEQAKFIATTVDTLQAAIESYVEQSPRRRETVEECLAQIDRLRRRLQATHLQGGDQPDLGESAPGVEEVLRFHVRSPRLAQTGYAADFAKGVVEEPRVAGLR